MILKELAGKRTSLKRFDPGHGCKFIRQKLSSRYNKTVTASKQHRKDAAPADHWQATGSRSGRRMPELLQVFRLCFRLKNKCSSSPLTEKLWITGFQDFPAGNREKF
jgi:hypothetical protein